MKILYVCRVFSGFETSIETGTWRPTGAPTIYKVIEALDKSAHDVRFVMTSLGVGRDFRGGGDLQSDTRIHLQGLRNSVLFLGGERALPSVLGRLRSYLTSVRHFFAILRELRDFKPDLVYVDRGNLISGALLARYFGARVVLRVMGVYTSMWDVLNSRHPANVLQRWAYKAPYAQVICTQDGSGGEEWLGLALDDRVPRVIMLNGVDEADADVAPYGETSGISALPDDKIIVLFVGRLETIKGCDEFVAGMLRLKQTHADRVHAVVIGHGSRSDALREQVRVAGGEEMFTFIDRVAHQDIAKYHHRADIYVSLNQLGNLSNANLEAFAQGACLVMPEARGVHGIDVATQRLIPDDAVKRLALTDIEDALATAVRELADDPAKRRDMSENLKKVAAEILPSWDDRVRQELTLLERVGS